MKISIHKMFHVIPYCLCLSTVYLVLGLSIGWAQSPPDENINNSIEPPHSSAHKKQMEELKDIRVQLEPDILEAQEKEKLIYGPKAPLVVTPSLNTSFIVFGYQQANGYEYHYRWHALTHIGYTFISISSTGSLSLSSWNSRPSGFKAGGAAEANGVKVVMVVANSNFDEGILNYIMPNSSRRANLINNIISAVTTDSYCAGVSLDFEFSWGATTRDGISQFIIELNSALKSLPLPRELSVYVHPIYSTTYWDIPTIKDHVDYLLYSCYDWGSGSTPHAISDINNCIPYINDYIDAGIPSNRMVLVISAYGRNWSGVTTYNQSGSSSDFSIGFQDGLYDTSLQPTYSGPYVNNYVTGDETGWYYYNSGTNHTAVWDDTESMEYKIRLARSMQDSGAVNNGKPLGGVGFWSLYWMATGTSYDPISSTVVNRTRTYGQIYQLLEKIFSPPGDRNYMFEKFEGPSSDRDFRWRDPDESPDTKGTNPGLTNIAHAASPAGTGRPPNTDNALQLSFNFASTSNNQLFLRHEILNDNNDTGVTDKNSAKVYVNRNSKITGYIYASGAYSGRQVRMIGMDTTRRLNKSNPVSLGTSGWKKIEWDLTDSSQVSAYTTSEPAFLTGTGTFASSTTGAEDIAFIGFLVEGGSSGSGTLYFDELSYTPTNPGGNNYVINEFRYSDSAQEFVEIYGPAGAIPSGMQIRVYNRTNGSILKTVSLSGSIPNDGGGFGYFVVGDPGVPNVDFTTGFGAGTDDISNNDPTALQLYNAVNGNVYDSVVYEAMGGLDDLIRKQTLGVTQNGSPWLGEIGPGSISGGQTYTMGRYPNGNDTYINGKDFSFMPPTPGSSNGGSVSLGTNYNFTSAPTNAFQTYQSFAVANPVTAGLPASPNGGNAYRCVDASGGGVIGVIGDASLGYNTTGYQVTGEYYIPSSSADTQTNAIGICGRQGSTFFTSIKSGEDSSGYESGYWLIFENRSGASFNDGRADHPGVFEFVHASNDNMDSTKVVLLGSASLASTGIAGGAWTTFKLSINTSASPSSRLVAQINNVTIYSGDIPAGGPTNGAFQVGFRENHTGSPSVAEGTWIDNVTIQSVVTDILNWELY